MTDPEDRKATLAGTPSLQMAIRMLAADSIELQQMIDTELGKLGADARIATIDEAEQMMGFVEEEDGPPPPPMTRFIPFGLTLNEGPPPDVVMKRDGPVQFFLPSAPFVRPLGRNRDALWLSRSLVQRARTITRIGQAMVDEDPDTFLGDASFMAQSIRKLADRVGMYESTIKRVCQHSRILCPAGTITFAAVVGMR